MVVKKSLFWLGYFFDPTSLLESLKEISSISNDFKDLRTEHLGEAESIVNMASFKLYIKEAKSGYYYRKFFISFLLELY